jgi:phenylacetate-CoA ligase
MKYKDKIYRKSPWWLQNIFINVWALTNSKSFKYKNGFARHINMLAETEKYSKDELAQYSFHRFKKLINYCYEYVPYYEKSWKNLDLNPVNDIKEPDDVARIPTLTKDDVRENYHNLFSRIARKFNPVYSHTSGTTGTPLNFAVSLDTHLNYLAILERYRRWFRYDHRKWTASFGGKEITGYAKNGPKWRYCIPYQSMSGMSKMIIYDSLSMNAETVKLYANHMKKKGVRYIKGYPSNLFEFANILDDLDEEIHMEAVFTGSEPLHDFIEDKLKKKFKINTVADFYGNSERVAFSHMHPEFNGYFIPTDSVWVEIIDPQTRKRASGSGEVVGTNLLNYVMPLVRYRTGDSSQFVAIDSHLPFPSMERVYTKYEDSVLTNDNSIISPSSLTHPFKGIPLFVFKKTQIRQTRPGDLTIYFVPGKGFDLSILDILRKNFNERFKSRFTVIFEEVEEIEKEKSGKFRWVVNETRSFHRETQDKI